MHATIPIVHSKPAAIAIIGPGKGIQGRGIVLDLRFGSLFFGFCDRRLDAGGMHDGAKGIMHLAEAGEGNCVPQATLFGTGHADVWCYVVHHKDLRVILWAMVRHYVTSRGLVTAMNDNLPLMCGSIQALPRLARLRFGMLWLFVGVPFVVLAVSVRRKYSVTRPAVIKDLPRGQRLRQFPCPLALTHYSQ